MRYWHKWLLHGLAVAVATAGGTGSYARTAADTAPADIAATLLAEQWSAISSTEPPKFVVRDGTTVGLFDAARNGVVTVPLAVLREARSIGDIQAYLALRRVYWPDKAEPHRHHDVANALLGYTSLLVSETVRDRDTADPQHGIPYYPPSALDNAPGDPPSRSGGALLLSTAITQGGCPANAIAMLKRLSSDGAAPQHGLTVQQDARAVLRALGMFAFHPPAICNRSEDRLFAALKSSLNG